MSLLTVNYRYSGRYKPNYLNNAMIEETAAAVRSQLVSGDTDALALPVLRDISHLRVNGIRFDLWVDLDQPVSDRETGEPVCGLCEIDPGAGTDVALLCVSPVGDRMTEELVLSTFGHELGHAVFEAPGWIADSKAGPGLFGQLPEAARKAYRTTTSDAEHLTRVCAPPCGATGSPVMARETEREKEMRIAEYRANEFMGSLLVPRSRLIAAVMELAPKYDVTVVPGSSLLDGDAPGSITIKADGVLGAFDLENLQKAIGKRFGVHGRFVRVRMARYGILEGSRSS